MTKPTAILTADIELRAHTPVCRLDDHWQAQAQKIKWLRDLAEEFQCPVFDAGDLFDKRYKQYPDYGLVAWAIQNLPSMFSIPGNHDLPGKTFENYKRSAMYVLEQAGVVQSPYLEFLSPEGQDIGVYGFPWGVPIEQPTLFQTWNVALVHAMVYDGNPPFPGCTGYEKNELLALLPDFDLIVSGHNHQTFTGQRGKTLLVNPGSLMRNDADQADHKPCVFLWYADKGIVRKKYVPIKTGVISREHIDEVTEKEERLSAFVEKLGQQTVTGINFEANLEQLVQSSRVSPETARKVWEYVETKRGK